MIGGCNLIIFKSFYINYELCYAKGNHLSPNLRRFVCQVSKEERGTKAGIKVRRPQKK